MNDDIDQRKPTKIHIMHGRRMEMALDHRGSVAPRHAATGGLTFAYIDQGETIKVAVARCRINEHYCRKLGAKEAIRKLQADAWIVLDKVHNAGNTLSKLITEQAHLRKNMRLTLKR